MHGPTKFGRRGRDLRPAFVGPDIAQAFLGSEQELGLTSIFSFNKPSHCTNCKVTLLRLPIPKFYTDQSAAIGASMQRIAALCHYGPSEFARTLLEISALKERLSQDCQFHARQNRKLKVFQLQIAIQDNASRDGHLFEPIQCLP